MTKPDQTAERAEFEAYWEARGVDVSMRRDAWGRLEYVHSHVGALWDGWKSGRAALSAAPPTFDAAAAAAVPALVQQEPSGGACPRGDARPEPTCTNRHQCWEPCGELGHSAEHVRVGRTSPEDVRRVLGATAAPVPSPEPTERPAGAAGLTDIDVEDLILKCIPGGDTCDPQKVADAIREYAIERAVSAPQPINQPKESL